MSEIWSIDTCPRSTATTWRHVSAQIAKAADAEKDLLEIASRFAWCWRSKASVVDEMTDDWSDEQINDTMVADMRNFYKVEKWARDK